MRPYEHDNMQNLPEKIKELRKRKRMTQAVLAQAAGISRQAYNTFERGESELKSDNLMKVCKALGVEFISQQTFYNDKI